ncbi:VOC family protein [Bradyrhizobium sp. WD16]|uniref:VOC family protein n=1 Tax=Bradyrhizobium sp. WD16 TaxID=1521768 RepID=UPI0020A4A5FC|nr:VOC family protein [Bradyrhizobium sp. WD16]
MHRRLSRLQMQPEPVGEKSAVNTLDGKTLSWRRTRSATAVNHGVRLFYLAREAERPHSPAVTEPAVQGLDHVVVTSPDPERAAALYGARLGLDMRLDLSRPDWGARLMFFRCGDLIVEIAHRFGEAPASPDDKLTGLSWRVDDAEAARARLAAAGVEVSAVRAGRKPGTRIFTVKNRSAGVPTLMIEPAEKPA